jgi:hypothetical protein
MNDVYRWKERIWKTCVLQWSKSVYLFYFLFNLLGVLTSSVDEFKSISQPNTASYCRQKLASLLLDRLLQSIICISTEYSTEME